MTRIESIDGIREYQINNARKVILDTNILIAGCDGKKESKEMVREICSELNVCISDTVYWEFLRNTGIEKFRERRVEIASWKTGDLLREGGILREDENVREMHARLFLLLIKFSAHEPRHVLRLLSPDLWIAAAAIHSKCDHILTTNKDDFPVECFEEIACLSAGEFRVHLLSFRRQKIRDTWATLGRERSISISCHSFFPALEKNVTETRHAATAAK
jgi:predicted nucleic acid-binding protein